MKRLNRLIHNGIATFFLVANNTIFIKCKTIFSTTESTQPTIITNSLNAAGMVKCVWRRSRQNTKKTLQMKATRARNKSQRME